jgi:hypothetical protein
VLLLAVPLQNELDEASIQHGMRCVILDTRQLTPPGETVRNFMIGWLDRHPRLDIQALVMHSELIAVRASMDALAKGIARRGFRTIGQAEVWITTRMNKK